MHIKLPGKSGFSALMKGSQLIWMKSNPSQDVHWKTPALRVVAEHYKY